MQHFEPWASKCVVYHHVDTSFNLFCQRSIKFITAPNYEIYDARIVFVTDSINQYFRISMTLLSLLVACFRLTSASNTSTLPRYQIVCFSTWETTVTLPHLFVCRFLDSETRERHKIGFGHLDEARASNVQVQVIWLLAYFWTYVLEETLMLLLLSELVSSSTVRTVFPVLMLAQSVGQSVV